MARIPSTSLQAVPPLLELIHGTDHLLDHKFHVGQFVLQFGELGFVELHLLLQIEVGIGVMTPLDSQVDFGDLDL